MLIRCHVFVSSLCRTKETVSPHRTSRSPTPERLIGDAAKNQAALNPENTIFDVKRLVGRTIDDKNVQKDIKLFPYRITDREGRPYIEVTIAGKKKQFSPEEISAMILVKCVCYI